MSKYGNTPVKNFRSKKEARFAELLEENGINYEYESTRYELLSGFDFPYWGRFGKVFKQINRVRPITYTPDFRVGDYVIEIKGYRTTTYSVKKKLFLKYLSDNEPHIKFVEINSVSEMKSFIIKYKLEHDQLH